MALTLGSLTYDVQGTKNLVAGTIAFDSSYAKGGEALTAATLGLSSLVSFAAVSKNGYKFNYNHTDSKLLVHYAQSLGVVTINTTAVGNVGTGTDNLMTYALPANTLSVNNMGVRVTAWGTGANNANAKTLVGAFGSATIVSTALTASQVNTWRMVMEVLRTGAGTQEAVGQLLQAGTTAITDIEQSAPTQDETAAITIKLTGAATTDNDIVQEGMIIEVLAPQGTGTVGVEVMDASDLSGLTGVRFVAVGY